MLLDDGILRFLAFWFSHHELCVKEVICGFLLSVYGTRQAEVLCPHLFKLSKYIRL